MKNTSKSPFADRFKSYIERVLQPHKNEQLFKGQFSQSPQNSQKTAQSPNRNYNELINSSSAKQNNLSSRYSFNSSEFSYSQLDQSSLKSKHSSQRKRLKKLKELEENECSICLDQIKNQCWLECKHKFCLDCLQEWLHSSNRCPYCRTQLTHFWHKGEQFKVQPRQFEYSGSEQENMDWVCYNCDATHEGDIVLICDRCEAHACHVDCDPLLRGVEPQGDWYCHFCR